MAVLPTEIAVVLAPFAGLFSQPTWLYAQRLLCGAILTCGTRTVCAILRTLGLGQYRHFQNYHRVLNRARWFSRQAARLLFAQLVEAFVPTGHLERRRGERIAARGIYRDSARSSRSFFVKSSGLRWIEPPLAGPDSLGWASVGAAVSDGAGPLGALSPGARPKTQDPSLTGRAWTGMDSLSAGSNTPPARQCGITRGCRRCRSAGCGCAIPKGFLKPVPF